MLLALGTFTAGVHILSWQICLLGIIMAFCVPAAAWIEASALIVALISIAALGIGFVLWWHGYESRAQKSERAEQSGNVSFGEIIAVQAGHAARCAGRGCCRKRTPGKLAARDA